MPSPTTPAHVSEQTTRRSILPAPEIAGPRVRLGVFWFLLAAAAATSGRWWTAVLWSVIAGIAGFQVMRTWQRELLTVREGRALPGGGLRLITGVLAAAVPLSGGYGSGFAGLVLMVVVLVVVALHVVVATSVRVAGPAVSAVVLPAVAALSAVLAVRADLWAGLFVLLAVSMYDAGSFLMGADAGSSWEGPVAGMIGALAVTFTIAMLQPPPFDRVDAWIIGATTTLLCPIGQIATAWFLPPPPSHAPAMRRLDAYLIAGPVFVALTWALTG